MNQPIAPVAPVNNRSRSKSRVKKEVIEPVSSIPTKKEEINDVLSIKLTEPVPPKKEGRSIPKSLREEVWTRYCGKTFEKKCSIRWCSNKMTVFNYECGHDIPFSKGGKTTIENLIPICGKCNKSMSDNYTIQEYSQLGKSQTILNRFKFWIRKVLM